MSRSTTRATRPNALLSAVLAGLPVAGLLMMSTSARAQYQVGGNGHLNDANTRLGSGGFNAPSAGGSGSGINNNIVTRNVGGLSYFHGNNNGEFDSSVFQGNVGSGPSDRLNAISTQGNIAAPNTGQSSVTPYYSASTLVTPPPGNFVATPNGIGLIPAPTISPLVPDTDVRLQMTNVDPTRDNLAAPGDTQMSGPVDPTGKPSLYSMSPLYGVRSSDGSDNSDTSSTSGTSGSFFNSRTSNFRPGTPADRQRMDAATVQKLRDELNKDALPDDQTNQAGAIVTPGAIDVSKGAQIESTNASSDANLSGAKPIDAAVGSQQITGTLDSGQSLQSTLIVAPAKQSTQLKELERRYAKTKGKVTDVVATERLNAERRALAAGTAKPTPGTVQPDKTPGTPDTFTDSIIKPAIGIPDANKPTTHAPLKPVLPGPDSQIDNTPYVVTSLATGIQAKGLADLMKTAEDQMRRGKFIEAVDSYQTAQAVAPNNPFVALGRSFAELGASYYGKADADLGRAIDLDPAILAGQYDLKGFIGDDRLQFVQKDLQDIAAHEKGARPMVLLAFIAHNSGDDKAAGSNLNDATTRGGYEKLIGQLRTAWNIKSADH